MRWPTFEPGGQVPEVVLGAPAEQAAQPVGQLQQGDERADTHVHLLVLPGATASNQSQPDEPTPELEL